MPIVDGLTSTKMIRSFEKSHPQAAVAARTTLNGRVPVFAVSASLVERERETYVRAGFDGWILKPIDFGRLQALLAGIVDAGKRHEARYRPGEWERGGWFTGRQPGILAADTTPSGESPTANPFVDGPVTPKRTASDSARPGSARGGDSPATSPTHH